MPTMKFSQTDSTDIFIFLHKEQLVDWSSYPAPINPRMCLASLLLDLTDLEDMRA